MSSDNTHALQQAGRGRAILIGIVLVGAAAVPLVPWLLTGAWHPVALVSSVCIVIGGLVPLRIFNREIERLRRQPGDPAHS